MPLLIIVYFGSASTAAYSVVFYMGRPEQSFGTRAQDVKMDVDEGTRNVNQTSSEIVNVDVESERLQDRYVQTESHNIISLCFNVLQLEAHKLHKV